MTRVCCLRTPSLSQAYTYHMSIPQIIQLCSLGSVWKPSGRVVCRQLLNNSTSVLVYDHTGTEQVDRQNNSASLATIVYTTPQFGNNSISYTLLWSIHQQSMSSSPSVQKNGPRSWVTNDAFGCIVVLPVLFGNA